jgi:hypothetical protein
LVPTALSYVSAHTFVAGSISAMESGAGLLDASDLSTRAPTPMALTQGLLCESFVLSQRQLDVLDLAANMAMTRAGMSREGSCGTLSAMALQNP